MRPSPCRVLLLSRCPIARTHHPALRVAARPHPHAPLRGPLQPSIVRRKRKMSFQLRARRLSRSRRVVPQILQRVVHPRRIRQLAGIHPVVRIPQRLELAKCLNQLRSEHLRQQRRTRLPVPMLATERPAETQHYIRRAPNKLAKLLLTLNRSKIEVDARVHAPLPIMPVQWAAISVLRHQRRNRAQIIAQLCGRNCRIFPALPAVRLAGNKNHRAQCRLAHAPNCLRFLRRANMCQRRRRPGPAAPRQLLRLRSCLLFAPGAHLHQQKANPRRQLIQFLQRQPLAPHEIHQQMIESLQPDRPMFKRKRYRVSRQKWIVEAQHRQHPEWRTRGQIQRRGNNIRARPLRSHQRPRHVEMVLRQ